MSNYFRAIIFVFGIQQIFAGNVKVSVFYEALCPDSIHFIDYQLFPTYKFVGNDIQLNLVPYGFAKVTNDSGKLQFECQHGPQECYGNKIHSCAIALYSVEESTEFIYCAINSTDSTSDETYEKCANSAGISWTAVEMCYTSGQADKLLEENGVKTDSVQPAITSIPTIIFEDHYNKTLQDEAITDFMGVVCEFLDNEPSSCKKGHINEDIEVKLVL